MAEGEWSVDCSDEEVEAMFHTSSHGYSEPVSSSSMEAAYSAVTAARDGAKVLDWSSPYGRRPPTPQSLSDSHSEDEHIPLIGNLVDTSGFDFSDDASSVRLPRRMPGTGTPKGSAKKKTTSFENILASVRRQKKIEAREKTSRAKNK